MVYTVYHSLLKSSTSRHYATFVSNSSMIHCCHMTLSMLSAECSECDQTMALFGMPYINVSTNCSVTKIFLKMKHTVTFQKRFIGENLFVLNSILCLEHYRYASQCFFLCNGWRIYTCADCLYKVCFALHLMNM